MRKLESSEEWDCFLKTNGIKVAILTTDWCGVCKQLIKSIDRAQLTIPIVQISSSTIPHFRSKQKINTYPTACLFDSEKLVTQVATSKLEVITELTTSVTAEK